MANGSNMIIYDYEYFTNMSMSLNRLKHKLPNESLKKFHKIKQTLHIKESSNFKRPFVVEKTKLVKQKDEVAKVIILLNKISNKTYEKLSKELFECVKSISDVNYQREICDKIFTIISSNDFYSEIYAKLYMEMIQIHHTFKNVFDEFIDSYIQQFIELKHVSNSDDYDEYCKYNKELNKIKSFTTFLNHCLNYNLCTSCTLIDMIICFQNKIISQIDETDKLSENEVLLNNIFILFKENIDVFSFHENWEKLMSNHKVMSEIKGPGKNNMMRFKLMDMDDLLKKKGSN